MAVIKLVGLAGLFLSSLVAAETITSPPAPAATESSESSRAPQTKTISVGFGDHKFTPDVTFAEKGDTIRFQFYPANHSVVRAEYMVPCVPYEKTGQDKQGFFSGFHPVDAILDEPPIYDVLVNDSLPIFFYCSAPGSCIDYSMVGVINPNKSTSLKAHQEAAAESKFMLQPGEPFPEEGETVTDTESDATETSSDDFPANTDGNDQPLPADAASEPKTEGKTFSTGAIAGVAAGGAALLFLAAGLFFYIGRAKSLKQALNRQSATAGTSTYRDPEMHQISAPVSAYYPDGRGPFDTPSMYSGVEGNSAHEVASNPPGSPRNTTAAYECLSPNSARMSRFSEMRRSPSPVVHEMPAPS